MMLKNAGIIIPAYLTEKFLRTENENLRTKALDKNAPEISEINSSLSGNSS